jgi:tetraacyldisaccharide 4'-kinase
MIEKIFNKVWYTQKGEDYFLFCILIRLSMLPITFIYYMIISLRRCAYEFNLLKTYSFKTPIIVVGNHTVGGSGKTPFCIWLANHLSAKGFKVGIVSSGYKSSSNIPQLVDDKSHPDIVGDEAVLMSKLTKANIVSCGNRVEATKVLINKFHNNIIIHDDGLQHLALGRKLEIILSKNSFNSDNYSTTRFSNLLPSGPYRDLEYKKKENSFNNRIYAHGCISTINNSLINSVTNTVENIEAFKNKTVHLVSGIASVSEICSSLKQNKINVIIHKYNDHYKFNGSEFDFNDSRPIFVTAKDHVKLYSLKNEKVWIINQELIVNKDFIKKIDKKVDLII